MEILTVFWTIVKVVLGISFVIFWHELGHFLLAKWNGVHVKTFSIGFPPTMIRLFRLKETDYVLSWIPLGGYVHMLGEDESLARPEEEGGDPSVAKNPAAFFNKSVWARMAIISAGVVMNVILGFACFVATYLMGGRDEVPPIIGDVAAGGPAYRNGMRPGDEIIAIDEIQKPTFDDLFRKVSLSVNDQVVRFTVRRRGADEPVVVPIEPMPDPISEIPTIRVSNARTLELVEELPYVKPPGLEDEPRGVNHFKGGDRIRAVGPVGQEPTPVSSPFELNRLLIQYRDQPLDFIVARREASERDGKNQDSSSAREVTVTVPPNHFVDFGFRLKAGPIASIQPDSPADRAELEPGDRIVAVDGDPDFDPMRLPERAFERAEAGEPMTLTVRKAGTDEPVDVEVDPVGGLPWMSVSWNDDPLRVGTWIDEPLDVSSLGLALRVVPEISAVDPGSPADRAGLKPGDRIEAFTYTRPSLGESEAITNTIRLGDEAEWPAVFDLMQQYTLQDIQLQLEGRDDPVALAPEPVADWYDPRRGLIFDSLSRPMEPLGLAEAVSRASEETLASITSFYVMLQGLTQQRVGTKNLAGPIRIVSIAYRIAGRSFVELLHFIGFISINLAVVNFLPIPPLDGGKMVFLIGEAVRGRPLPESWQAIPTYLGVLFLLMLMAFVLLQDAFLEFF